MTAQATRPIAVDELAEHLAHGWTCCRCLDQPAHVHVRLGYRLCSSHAGMAARAEACDSRNRRPWATRALLSHDARTAGPRKVLAFSWLRIAKNPRPCWVEPCSTEPKVGSSNLSGRAGTGPATRGQSLQTAQNHGLIGLRVGRVCHTLAHPVRGLMATVWRLVATDWRRERGRQ